MKLFTASQIRNIDSYTMKYEPISSIDLMERASLRISDWMSDNLSINISLWFFAGPGNNGGDALATARMMADRDFTCEVFLINPGKELKGSPLINWNRLEKQGKVKLNVINSISDLKSILSTVIVVDGLFGSGLNRKTAGLFREVIDKINNSGAKVISIDVPSGLEGEDNSKNDLSGVVRADFTLTLQFPKISLLFSDHENMTGQMEVLPIGLHHGGIDSYSTPFYLLDKDIIKGKLPVRKKFSHKGTYGHCLLIAGSTGMAGAAILSSEACLRGGAGLLTVHLPKLVVPMMQVSVPEAICSSDSSDDFFTGLSDCSSFSAVGIGPGIGKNEKTVEALKKILMMHPRKLVLDADALNILSENMDMLDLLPENTILTPHPKEFERLVGKWKDSWSGLCLQRDFSSEYKVIVVLKGAYTSISLPNGDVWFNTTGNPGMATAGSGDVLTGLILGLLSQHLSPEDSALIGVYLHGLSGDLAEKEIGQESMLSGDLIRYFGKAFLKIRN